MQTTVDLIAKASKVKNLQDWTKELKLGKNTLYSAKERGRLSPVVAGALADKLGEDAKEWIAIASLENERESGAKDYLSKRLNKWRRR